MIHTNRIVTVGEQESIIDRPIVLYRGDREVEIEFTLVGNEFMFSEEGNVIKSVNASHGQLVLNTPSGEHMFSELAECHEGKVVFVVTKEMIDEFIEMGFYSFQIRLYDSAEMKSRVTIPPVMNGFDIRNPIAAEDETNVVDQGIVDYARIFKDQSNEELPTFTWDGEYVKTEWAHHDVITENKLNKIEDALYSINANIKESDVVMLNALDNVKKDADKYVKEHMAEIEADVEEFERNLNTDVQKFKADTNAAMTAHKNEVGEELEGFSDELESVNSQLARIEIDITNYSDYVIDDDWTAAFEEAFKNRPCVVYVPKGFYNIKYIKIPSNSILSGAGYETIFNVISDGEQIHNIITNSDYENGNENIIIRNFLLLCNRLTTSPPNAYGSGVVFANVKGGICENVRVENPSLHCFDAMADKPYQLLNPNYSNNASYSESNRSRNIIFRNCEAYMAGDDNFTCHHSDYIYFINCRAEANFYDEGSENRNGFEVDDGSRNITLRDCYATLNARGYEIKAHEHSYAPENVTLDNCVADNCVIGFQVRHLEHHLADEEQSNGKNVTINNCKCYNPTANDNFPSLVVMGMQISAFTGVYIYNFYCEGNNTVNADRAVMSAQYKSRNVIIDGLTIKGFTHAKQALYIVGGAQHADNIHISNVYIDGCTEGIVVGNGVENVTITNVIANLNGLPNSKGVACSNENPKLNNIAITNAEVNIIHGSKTMNDLNKSTVLWTGSAYEGGTILTLSDSIYNYDYLLFDIYIVGYEQRILNFKDNDSNYIKGINLGDSATSTLVTFHELRIEKDSNTQLSLTFNYKIALSNPSVKTTNDSGVKITGITGIRR